jgi:hypothetical protein
MSTWTFNHLLKEMQLVGGPPALSAAQESVADLSAYPILTEIVPSSLSWPKTGPPGPGSEGLGQAAASAISDVLGWKTNATDAKGFLGALTQSFTLTEVEGHIESSWSPRTYTVQTDLAGGITGAQASLYTRAREAQDQCLQLLDGLYPLNPDADPEYVKALREMAKSQIIEIVKQFAVVPPSISRVNTYFNILLGAVTHLVGGQEPPVEANPDQIAGTLGHLRDLYGIWFEKNNKSNPLSNSVEDEQDITNFRVISDYMTSLLQSWLANRRFFRLDAGGSGLAQPRAFLGTQLILMSRQFNVVAENVNEVRFTLDSVFIGPNERQQLRIDFSDGLPAMYFEDVLQQIEGVVTDEGPRLIRNGGRIAIGNNLQPVIKELIRMITGAQTPQNIINLPKGYSTPRVRNALNDLLRQLVQLQFMAKQVEIPIP